MATDPSIAVQIAGGITSVGAGIVATIGSAVLSPMVNAATRGITYESNANWPTQIPPPEAVISAWLSGHLKPTSVGSLLVAHGIPVPPLVYTCGNANIAESWYEVIASNYFRPGESDVLRAITHELVSPGMRATIDKRYKFDRESMEALWQIYQGWPTNYEVMQLHNRGYFSDEEYAKYMKHAGGFPNKVINAYSQLKQGIPGVSDLIRMSVREAFSENQDITDKLDVEFKESGPWPDWLAAQGIGLTQSWRGEKKGTFIDWARMYWRTHWVLMSTGQAQDSYHRFRPDRIKLYQDEVPGLKPFTFADLQQLLKQNDFLPAHREWIAALAFPPPRLVDLRKMWFTDRITDADYVAYQRDNGQTKVNAELTMEAWREEKARYQYRRRTPLFDKYDNTLYAQIIESFREGASTEGELRATLTGLLRNQDAAEAVVVAEVLRKKLHIVKEFTRTVRQQFLTGEVLAVTALATLIDGGMNEQHARQLVSLWQTSFSLPRKAASVSMVRSWYFAGIIDEDSVRMRLSNLGYSGRDVELLMVDMRVKKLAKDKKESGKRGGKGGKESNYETPATIAKWFNKGYITVETAKAKLDALNVPVEDQDYWLEIAQPPAE